MIVRAATFRVRKALKLVVFCHHLIVIINPEPNGQSVTYSAPLMAIIIIVLSPLAVPREVAGYLPT